MANLIFQSWLKDSRYILRTRIQCREAIQMIKDFTGESACDEVEFYMEMVAEDEQTFEGLMQHLKNAFQSGETKSELMCDFYS